MTSAPVLHWLPEHPNWREAIQSFRAKELIEWPAAVRLANTRLDFVQTNQLDAIGARAFGGKPPEDIATKPVRLAILGSSTLAHLHSGIRVAALRRNIHLTTYENDYGQYRQELADAGSGLHAFRPTAILFAFDPWHVTAGIHAGLTHAEAEAALDHVRDNIADCWRLAREGFGCQVLQQTIIPAFGGLVGNNEHRLSGSKAHFVQRLNTALRAMSDTSGVDLIGLDQRTAQDGLSAWHDIALWHRSKQEVSPRAAPMYGELVARVLAATQGRSYKCLVLDLDNTLWGGVVGDDGIDGLVLGQGSATGEAFVAIQDYAKDLSRRGVILAVCSKNDERNVIEAFDRHPEMVLARSDIACLVANWDDKAGNLRRIARDLNIGLDALVFLDDNPAERGLVRQELPMVAVPEVPEDPTLFPRAIVDAGYFESVSITNDDRERNEQYQRNRAREVERASATDMGSFLSGLDMTLIWTRFDATGQARITQLINKTNQFNLTTRRYTTDDVAALIADERALGLQLRLVDRFGDNGIIAVVIGRMAGADLVIDTWLMSCRVLGRQVEAATLNLIVEQARAMGAKRILGDYIPTAKNGMVREHYQKLGFSPDSSDATGWNRSSLSLDDFQARSTPITITQG